MGPLEQEHATLLDQLYALCNAFSRRDAQGAHAYLIEVLRRNGDFFDEDDRVRYLQEVVDAVADPARVDPDSDRTLFRTVRAHAVAAACDAIGAIHAARWTVWDPDRQGLRKRLGLEEYARIAREQGVLMDQHYPDRMRALCNVLRAEIANLQEKRS